MGPMDWASRLLEPLAAYPRWFVILCVVLASIAVGWIALKAVKWALYLLLTAALLLGVLLLVSWFLG